MLKEMGVISAYEAYALHGLFKRRLTEKGSDVKDWTHFASMFLLQENKASSLKKHRCVMLLANTLSCIVPPYACLLKPSLCRVSYTLVGV